MDLKQYQELCKLTAKKNFKTEDEEISSWGLGVTGEAGDVASCIKKVCYHKNLSVKEGIKENLGDMMWYAVMICNFYGWDFSQILNENIRKLRERYPNGFTEKNAQRNGSMLKWSGEGEVKAIGDKK